MPWVVRDVDRFVKGLSRTEKRLWVAVANSALESCQAEKGTDCEAKAIQIASGRVKKRKEREKKMSNTLGEVTKKIGARQYPASSFLVVGDPESVSTWHLPVKRPDGTPDRRLAGAAWAALFNPNGYRGNKYEGQDKGEAQRKLRALYKANDWEEPNSETEAAEAISEYDADLKEWYVAENDCPYVPSGVTSFDQLDTLIASQEMSENIRKLTGMYTQMVNNIVYWFEGDKIAQLQTVSDEFIQRLDDTLSGEEVEEPEAPETEEPEEPETMSMSDQAEADLTETLTESASGQVMMIEGAQPSDVLRLKIRVINPGWGNSRDNHYYGAEMLKRCADNFIGAKMYETDHREDEKSNRTWVSTITDIAGYTSDGAPIALVAVHDDNFASRVRNLNAAGLLEKLECSIFATGKAEAGFEHEGRKGKRVTEITDVNSVDWVTKAGAGGKALALAEAQTKNEVSMNDTEKGNVTAEPAVTGSEPKTESALPAEVQSEEAAVIDVAVLEDDKATGGSEPEKQPAAEAEAEQNTLAPLSEEAVRSCLEASNLPEAAQEKLASAVYADNEALTVAVEAEKAYLAKLLSAGKVIGMGEVSGKTSLKGNPESVQEAAVRVNNKYFGG